MKKIIFTGGGTAGHVTPNLSIINEIKDDYEIHYIGTKDGVEKTLIEKLPFVKYHTTTAVKFSRTNILKNFAIPVKLLKGVSESKKIIKQIQPNIVFSKGGFVAVPVAMAAYFSKVPVITHESDYTMGLANKVIKTFSKAACCSFEATAKKAGKKGVYTGTPIRREMFAANKAIAKQACNFKNELPIIMFMGGSMGAKAINEFVVKNIKEICKYYNVIHVVGKGNLTNTTHANYFQAEYLHDIQNYFAYSDIVVCRSGSNTINELLALKKPMVLIPLPKDSSRGDQILNAMEFEKNGYSTTLYQDQLSINNLTYHINNILHNFDNIIKKMNATTLENANSKIVSLIKKYEIK